MATGLTDIKRRLAATRKVTKTTAALQKVSTVKVMRSRRIQESLDAYTRQLVRIVQALAGLPEDHAHAFLKPGRGDHVLVVVFGSDRGLCGSFNSVLAEKLAGFVRSLAPAAVEVVPVGTVMQQRVQRLGLAIRHETEQPAMEELAPGEGGGGDAFSRVREAVSADFLGGRAREVHVLYSRFISALRQQPVITRLLPVALPAGFDDEAHRFAMAGFEPDLHRVVSSLLPEYLDMVLRHAAVNSLASENTSRQSSMARATENAAGIVQDLTVEYRRLRQESITTELLEIAGVLRTA